MLDPVVGGIRDHVLGMRVLPFVRQRYLDHEIVGAVRQTDTVGREVTALPNGGVWLGGHGPGEQIRDLRGKRG
jgi:hypothetical protein